MFKKSKNVLRADRASGAPETLSSAVAPTVARICSSLPFEKLEERRLLAASFDLGMAINDSSATVFNNSVANMRALGVKSVRMWYGPNSWNERNFDGALRRTIQYANAGFDVTLCIQMDQATVPNPSEVKGWFNWALSDSALRNAVDRWQVGNEPDIYPQFWKGTMPQYVNNLLKPAYEALKAHGEQVISAGPAYNVTKLQELVNAGMLNYCDYAGMHVYADTINFAKSQLAKVKGIIGSKPLMITEWNYKGWTLGSESEWAKKVEELYPIIKANSHGNYYFALTKNSQTRGGPGGILTSGGAKTAFYNAIARAKGDTGVVVGPDNPTTPSTTSKPNISALQIINASTGAILVNNITSSQTINLANLPTTNIKIQAVANSTTSSVKLSAFGSTVTDNTAPFQSNSKTVGTGSFAVSATSYSSDNAAGTVGNTLALTLTFTNTTTTTPTTPTTPTVPSTNGPAISKLQILDLKTYKVLVDNIMGSTSINLASLPTKNIAFKAITNSYVKSVKVTAFGKTITENAAPFTSQTGTVGAGSYTVAMTPYSATNLTGSAGATFSATITFTGSTAPAKTAPSSGSSSSTVGTPHVSAFQLINASTGKVISGYENITASKSIKLSSLPTRNIRIAVVGNSATQSVQLSAVGKTITENAAPYQTANWYATAGSKWVSATAYSKDYLAGTKGNTISLSLNFY